MKNIITKIVDKVGSDKVMHAETCALISAAVTRYAHNAIVGVLVALGVGVLKELYDMTTGEEFDWRDVAADAVGAVTGAVMFDF